MIKLFGELPTHTILSHLDPRDLGAFSATSRESYRIALSFSKAQKAAEVRDLAARITKTDELAQWFKAMMEADRFIPFYACAARVDDIMVAILKEMPWPVPASPFSDFLAKCRAPLERRAGGKLDASLSIIKLKEVLGGCLNEDFVKEYLAVGEAWQARHLKRVNKLVASEEYDDAIEYMETIRKSDAQTSAARAIYKGLLERHYFQQAHAFKEKYSEKLGDYFGKYYTVHLPAEHLIQAFNIGCDLFKQLPPHKRRKFT